MASAQIQSWLQCQRCASDGCRLHGRSWLLAALSGGETTCPQNAVPFGSLAMYAEDMYSAAPGTLNSPADARIAAAGWKVVGYLTAQDALIPAKGASDRKLGIDHGKRVFYGF